MIESRLKSVGEGSSVAIEVSFFDRYEVPAVPAVITYRVECLTTGALMLADTAFADPEVVIEIVLPEAVNAINDERNAWEGRRCTIMATGGDGFTTTDGIEWQCRNLTLTANSP